MSKNGLEKSEEIDAEKCNVLTQRFAEITGTDSACGHFYLQDCEWNIEIALNRFFGSESKKLQIFSNAKVKVEDMPPVLKIISWNIDGLDDKNLVSRTNAACNIVKSEKPSVVFLQELIPETFQRAKSALESEFEFISPSSSFKPYFNAILLRKEHVKQIACKIIEFSGSQMGRDLLQVEAEVNGRAFVFMTSHLESTKQYKTERMKQFRMCLDTVEKVPYTKSVFFGGDLNIRDDEVANKPEEMLDLWENTGRSSTHKFTWDCLQNDNISLGDTKFKPRCRFDRLYVRNSKPEILRPCENFKLIGKERIRSALCFPSDHWGLCAEFSFA